MSGLALTQPVGIGLGVQEPFAPANPAAGVNLSFVCDGNGLRRVQSIVLTLVTSAVVASRYLKLEWQGSDGNAYAVAAVAATQPASQTQRYVFTLGQGSQAWNTGTDAFAPLPPVFLSPGDKLVTVVASIDVGDQLSLIRGVVERYPLDGNGLPAAWWDS